MSDIDNIDDVDDKVVKEVAKRIYKPVTYEEHYAKFQAEQAAESATEVYNTGNGTAVMSSGNGQSFMSRNYKQFFVSMTAIIICLALLLGMFMYFHFRERWHDTPPEIPTDLNMVVIDADELHQQDIFIPNLDNLTNITLMRGDDRETGETKMFWISGYFNSNRVTIRIVVYEFYMPSDETYFEGGKSVEIHKKTVNVSASYVDGRYTYRLFFVETDSNHDVISYYIVLTTQNSGDYMYLLDELLRERIIEGCPDDPPIGDTILEDIEISELQTHERFNLNLNPLDKVTAQRAYDRESDRILFFVVDGYFGNSHVNIRIMVDDFYQISDGENFVGGRPIFPNDHMGLINDVRNEDYYLYRITLIYNFEIFHYIELTTQSIGEYESFLYAILK